MSAGCIVGALIPLAILTWPQAAALDAYRWRYEDAAPLEKVAFREGAKALWDSEDVDCFEAALVCRGFAHHRPRSRPPEEPGAKAAGEKALLDRFESSRSAEIKARALFYVCRYASNRALDVAKREFNGSEFPQVRGAALGVLLSHDYPDTFPREVVAWLSDPGAKVDLRFVLGRLSFWFKLERQVPGVCATLPQERQEVLVRRLGEYLGSSVENDVYASARALAYSRLATAGMHLIEFVDRAYAERARRCEAALFGVLGNDPPIPPEVWMSPPGIQLLRRMLVAGSDHSALMARLIIEKLPPERGGCSEEGIISLKYSALPWADQGTRKRLITDINDYTAKGGKPPEGMQVSLPVELLLKEGLDKRALPPLRASPDYR